MVRYLDNNNSGFAAFAARQREQQQQKKAGVGRLLWWMLLFVASFWLVKSWMTPPPVVPATADDAPVVTDASAVAPYEIVTDDISATVRGLRISDVKLKAYPISADDKNPVSVLGAENNFAEIGFIANGTTAPTATTTWTSNGDIRTWRSADGVKFERTITTDGYVFTVMDVVTNGAKSDIAISPYARIVRTPDGASSAGVYSGGVVYVNGDVEHEDWRTLDRKSYAYSTVNGFAGFVDQYWESVASVDSPDQTIRIKKLADNLYSSDVAAAPVTIAAGTSHTFTTNVFVGPRDQNILDVAATKITGINDTVDYGWFWFLAQPMAWILNALYALVMNYGVAIILFTLVLRLAMWPLTRKSYTSMIAMQKMQPELARIQKLYANDKMRLQMEMMKLYQTHKTSPMSGCLPMLIQLPIFFALYKALLVSVQMRSASFLWISDLAVMDPYFILPILMGATMWLQQSLQSAAKKNDNPNDITAQTQKMMKWMPVIFTVMFAWMPAGLVLYWTVSNIFGIAQMYIIKHKSK